MNEDKLRSFKHIAKLIRTKRQAHPKRYSQSELSQMLGYKNGQFISNVERGLCNVPLKMLNKVASILTINHDELKDALLLDHRSTLDNFLRSNNGEAIDDVEQDDERQQAANV